MWEKETLSYAGQTFLGLLKQEAACRGIKPENVRPYVVRGRTAQAEARISDKTLTFPDGDILEWEGFRQWDGCDIKKVCLYVLSIVHVGGSAPMMPYSPEIQYTEETCAVLALTLARKMLVKRYDTQWQQEGMRTSVILGPGYYGMRIQEAERICRMTDARQIGVSYEKGMLHPGFSLSGLFLEVPEQSMQLVNPCSYCIGDSGGCMWCEMRMKTQ